MHRTHHALPVVAALAVAGALSACGGGGSSNATEARGTLSVALTDAPACGFDAVNVTVQKVRVHQSSTAADGDSGWTDIVLPTPKKINLLNLTNGVLETLGQTSLPAGHYTQLRLVLDPNSGNSKANSVVLSTTPANTTEISLDTPSAVQSGIKLINEFDVLPGQQVDLVMDFDACKSVVSKGKNGYALKPVVKVIPTVLNGIDGYVNPALLTGNVSVSAQQNGVIVSATTPDTTGKFSLSRLAPGNYDVVITAGGHATGVIGAVPVVTSTSRVALSTQTAPIDLPVSAVRRISGIVTFNPVPTGEAPVAYVNVQQSFAAGPKVTVKYQGADVTTGDYAITGLPIAAPHYAQYTVNLPITLAPQTAVTPGVGKYSMAVSASGYATQNRPSIDLTTADQSGVDVTLTP